MLREAAQLNHGIRHRHQGANMSTKRPPPRASLDGTMKGQQRYLLDMMLHSGNDEGKHSLREDPEVRKSTNRQVRFRELTC